MDVRFAETEAEREACLALRWEVLRAPLGEPRGSETDEHEHRAVLAFARDGDGRVVATGRLHTTDARLGRIRYLAVRPDKRGRGYGRAVLRALEEEARRRGLAAVHLNARLDALPFYLAEGYMDSGDAPTYKGIPHRRLEKRLD